MTERCSYIIIGNGIAGITAAETLRNEVASAQITVIGDYPMPVYTRPALKDYLAGRMNEENLYARRRSFYADHGIHFVFDRAAGIAVNAHEIYLRSGRRLRYDSLLLAAGARARRLVCAGSDLAGVVTLRTIVDFQGALQQLEMARRVVVAGSGPVALETVEVLRHRGFHVTHLLRGRRAWPDVLDTTASNLVMQQELRAGIDVRTGEEIVEIVGRRGRVMGVIIHSGAHIPCDLLIMAIGSEPSIDFIAASGIPCSRGVKVDHTMRTGAPDIFAAGDVAEVIDPITGRPRCIGQWYPAIQQGRTAAYAMLGLLGPHHLLHPLTHSNAYLRSITTTSLFGLDIAAVGIPSSPDPAASSSDYQEVLAGPGARHYGKALLRNGIPIGALSFDDRHDMLAFKRAIDHAVSLAPVAACLFDRNFRLTTWLDAQKVPTPVLAVRKARAGDSSGQTMPMRPMKSQFAPLTGSFTAPANSLAETGRVRANGDPYTMPIVAARAPSIASATPTTRTTVPGGNLEKEAAVMGNTIAYLAPLLPLETARALRGAMPESGSHHPYSLSLESDAVKSATNGAVGTSSLAPAWTHTLLNPGDTVTIGRDPGVTLVLDHGTISRRHAEITCDGGRYLLRDLGSKNGTFVNGERLEPHRVRALQPRDQVRIGTLLTYLFDVRTVPPHVVH